MILADISVWIDYRNGTSGRHTDALDATIVEGAAVMGDLMFLETLQDIRDDKEYRATKKSLMTDARSA